MKLLLQMMFGVPFTSTQPCGRWFIKRHFKSCSAKSCHFDFKLDAKQAEQLKVMGYSEIELCLYLEIGKTYNQMQERMVLDLP